ncbi:hypothetical protein ALO50_102533 [Pseudomonas syringae pv. cerasicola]|uniref:Uncharacterized protein n=1 Tax=Pseudomonas syringae pv. cerasicola TaxID=264451 RepID=A0A0P9SHD6_PSESX|nr:hypothetical protein ALO50_102533 [Pseudomonas syringae pv. cerasicola]
MPLPPGAIVSSMSGTCTLCGDADLIIHTLLALRGFGGFQKDTIKLITGHGFLLA